MQRLEEAHNGATRQLVEGITSKASGVFLWVCNFLKRRIPVKSLVLVVKSILRMDDELPQSFVLTSFCMMVDPVSNHGHSELTPKLLLG